VWLKIVPKLICQKSSHEVSERWSTADSAKTHQYVASRGTCSQQSQNGAFVEHPKRVVAAILPMRIILVALPA
jgi:hypothetical protein